MVRTGVNGHTMRVYVMVGDDGWTLRDDVASGQLAERLIHTALIRVVILGAFIRLANNGHL
jgi:hypothetical protein